jgi:hypothetical protein
VVLAEGGASLAEIPAHLLDWAVPEEIPTDGFIFQFRLRCPCGGGRLRLLHPGEIHRHPEKEFAYPVGVTVAGQSFFLIRAECVECDRTKLVFDADIHGRTAVVQHDPVKAAAPRPQLLPWGCVRCAGEEHTAAVRYVLHHPHDFDFGVRPKCPTAKREDAFVWIGMDATCCRCGLFTWLWFEYETL